MYHTTYGDVSWERMERAVEKVRQRLLRAASALEQAGIPVCRGGWKCRGRLGLSG